MKIEPLENRAGFRVLAPAKVNLFFEILGKRPDGYREIETVVAPISLFDELEFERTETPGIAIESLDEIAGDDSDVPTDQTNLVAKAFRAFWEEKGTDPDFPPFGVKCRLTKRIPTRAGLGGGSSDAAACLLALDRLAPERTPKATLQKIAGRVGSDVALFLEPSASRGRGRGEIVEPLVAPSLSLVLLKPSEGLSTAAVYARSEETRRAPDRRASDFVRELALASETPGRAPEIVARALFNRLEESARAIWDGFDSTKELLRETEPLAILMSGSGTTFFGLYSDEPSARAAADRLRAGPEVASRGVFVSAVQTL
ncbi:MAG: 4-(cytidine 5'-diphospho)-2-C-methyl-D-erythritol kinase [Thermoguttaceae bacterium]|nr:4-(cytidine 5'-diphospho)-2-C-methyl-D-erythritol kinase [Thermoguttaceae bacterium]